jgi:hypothetical protein
MDKEEMLKQREMHEAVRTATTARAESRARAKAIVANIPGEDVYRVGVALTEDLVARLERLHNLKPRDNPAVVRSKVNIPVKRHIPQATRTVFDIEGNTVNVLKWARKGEQPGYSLDLADGVNHILSTEEVPFPTSFGQVTSENIEGSFVPFLGIHARRNLISVVECAESVRVIEEACGLDWPGSEEQAWLGQVLLTGSTGESAQAA